MSLTAITEETKPNTEKKGTLFERMTALLDSMDASLKQGLVMSPDRNNFLEIYIGGREKLPEWEQGMIDMRWSAINKNEIYKFYFEGGVHNGPSKYDCFTV